MKRILLALAVAIAMLPITSRPASAVCAALPPEELAELARSVFTGVARSVTDDGTAVARFKVRVVYKGSVPAHIDVRTSSIEGYEVSFQEGKRYTVFGTKVRNGETHTSICDATKRGGIHPPKFGLPPGDRR